MKPLRRAWKRLLGTFRRDETELAGEIEAHLQMQTEDNLRLGMGPEEARRQAVLKFGGIESAKESYRDQRGLPRLETFAKDVVYALRGMRKNPSFTTTVVLSLTLGIAVNSAVFSLFNAVMFGSMPYRDPDRLCLIWETAKTSRRQENLPAIANIVDWGKSSTAFEGIGFAEPFVGTGTLIADGPAEAAVQQAISPNLLSVLGVSPVLGRNFLADEDSAVLLSHEFWQRRFNGDARVLGRGVILGGTPAAIVGVMPPRFRVLTDQKIEMWVCANPHNAGLLTRKEHWFAAIGRLKPGVTVQRAQAEMTTIAARLAKAYPETNKNTGAKVQNMRESIAGDAGRLLYPLLAAVGFVLLISCANVANLLLARFGSRTREITVRASLGASRGRLVRQMLTESVVLAFFGGAAGFLLTRWVIRAFDLLMPEWFSGLDVTSTDFRVLLFTFTITALTAVLFGVVPAYRAARLDLSSFLKQASRTVLSRSGRRVPALLVVCEVALSIVLLAATGLMIRTLLRIQAVDPGFDPNNVLTMQTHLDGPKYVTATPGDIKKLSPDVDLFYARLLERASALPGVQSAAFTSDLPDTGIQVRTFTVAGQPPPADNQRPSVGYYEVSPGYFDTIRTPIRVGRVFDRNDRAGTPWTVVVDETFAKRFFPSENPVGKLIRLRFEPYKVDESQPRVIIGVVGSIKFWRRQASPLPVVYASCLQQPQTFPGGRTSAHLVRRLLLRTGADVRQNTATLMSGVKSIVAELDRGIPVTAVKTLAHVLDQTEIFTKYYARLLGAFAALAAILAAVGIYGVMSYSVTERTNEVGIRIALGANRRDVLGMVIHRSLALVFSGIAAGAAAALALTRLMSGFLFGVKPWDPATYAAVAAVLAAIALAASYVPARRAARLDPTVALRHE